MSADNETIADIVADIRMQNQGLPEDSNALSPLVCDLLNLADRIEAAAKRMEINGIINAALAVPPRNCDVGTAEEQAIRYGQYCDTYLRDDGSKPCTGCPCCGKIPFGMCEFAWAQMPYEEGGDK